MTVLAVKLIFAIIIFALYLELSPGLGNIWFRVDSSGCKKISLVNFGWFFLNPLYRPTLWQWELLDFNSIVFVLSITLIWRAYEDLTTTVVPLVPAQRLDKLP